MKVKQVSIDATVQMYAGAIVAFTYFYIHDLDLWPLTLKTFTVMPTHMMNICVKFHWNSSTKYLRDIALCKNRCQLTDNSQMYDLQTLCLRRLSMAGEHMNI